MKMKKIPENLTKLDNLETKKDFLSLVDKIPRLSREEAGFATHICNKFFKDNFNYIGLDSDEMERVLKNLDITRSAKELFDWFDRRASLVGSTLSDFILNKVLFFGSKEKRIVVDMLGEYFTIAYNNNNVVQMNLLAEFHPSTMDATIRELLACECLGAKPEFVDLLIKNFPELLLSYQKMFQEDLVLNVAKCNTDLFLEDFYFGVGFIHPKVKKEIAIHRAANFLNILGSGHAHADEFFTTSLWGLGKDFYDIVAKEMDMKKYLSGSCSTDLPENADYNYHPDYENGRRYWAKNFITKEAKLNRLQYWFLTKTSNDNVFELAEILRENFDLFNQPVIERINGIDFKICPVELAFKSNAMSGVFDYFIRVADKLSPLQEQIFASVFMRHLLEICNIEGADTSKFIFQVSEDLFENIRKDSWGIYMDAFQHIVAADKWAGAESVEKLLSAAYLDFSLPTTEGKKSLYKI